MTTFEKAGCCLGAALLLAAMTAPAAIADPCPQRTPPYPPQSPRFVDPDPWPGVYNGTPNVRSDSAFVSQIKGPKGDEILDAGQHLYLCDQHYHVPVENPQGPADERVILPGVQPQPGQWIEVHTVYAANDDAPSCRRSRGLDNDLTCCEKQPVVVRGFSAKVTATAGNVQGGGTAPLIPPVGDPLAEWSGSNTGPDKRDEPCKPTAAQWSFQLNRDLTVGKGQLAVFGSKVHGARGVQTESRLSKDLTLVAAVKPPPPPYKDATCAWTASQMIWTRQEAVAKCPTACKTPSPRWDGRWYNTTAASKCSCCK